MELLQYCVDHTVQNVVYVSSSEIYGRKDNNNPYQENEYGYIDILMYLILVLVIQFQKEPRKLYVPVILQKRILPYLLFDRDTSMDRLLQERITGYPLLLHIMHLTEKILL